VTEDGRGESIWDRYCHTPGKVKNSETGDRACDHYHRVAEDVELLHRLGLGAYRFSIAWPRVVPAGSGAVNRKGLDFYERLVDSLLARGIAPMATLYHWDLPQPLEDAGGWPNRDVARRFADYADVVYRALGDRVASWITINEPSIVAMLGYAWGVHAPGRRDRQAALATTHHLLLAHGMAVEAYRASKARGKIGIALSLSPCYPASSSAEDARAAAQVDAVMNRQYLDPVFGRGYAKETLDALAARHVDAAVLTGASAADRATIGAPIDFLGVNYYAPQVYRAGEDGKPESVTRYPTAQLEWEQIHPPSLGDLLDRLHRDYASPEIFITENGAAFPDEADAEGRVHDPARIAYIHDHLVEASRAIQRGVKLRGYFAWSLLDNFEWSEGYAPRFGLVRVDYTTLRRTPKASADWFSEVARTNALPVTPSP
jgi:beta-glucosidase